MLSNSSTCSQHSNPLDDHDYCSARPLQQPPSIQQQHGQQLEQTHEQPHEHQSQLPQKQVPSQQQTKPQQQPRQRRPRQNLSVTDKSQWITGEEQIESALSEHIKHDVREKRQRKEVHDPEFSHFTSSEYSSSDAESEPDSGSEYDENDPDKPWCYCHQPDDGKNMVSCDACDYWFHAKCIGWVTPKEGEPDKEFICSLCNTAISNGTPRDKIPTRVPKKPKKKSSSKLKKRRGRPRKVDGHAREVTTRQSTRHTRESRNSLDTLAKNKSSARSESFHSFDQPERLKDLIRERKEDFFRKFRASYQKKAEKKEQNLDRRSVTESLDNSLDALASNTSSPNMNNLPLNLKSEHKERTKPIVLQINTKKTSDADSSNHRIVTFVKKRKQSETSDAGANELFTADPIQIKKRSKHQIEKSTTPAPSTDKTIGDSGLPDGDSRGNVKVETPKVDSAKQSSTSKRKRKESESNTANGSSKHIDSSGVAQKIRECLEDRRKSIKDVNIPSNDVEKLAIDIEKELHDCFKVGTTKYLAKYRSLIFNMRDSKNQGLVRNVLMGEIRPDRLVRMSHDEMASQELAKWRERENKHSIELIKRESELAAQEVIIKKTHKGEEVIAAANLNDSDDLNASKSDEALQSTSAKALATSTVLSNDPAQSKPPSTDDVLPKTVKEEIGAPAPSFLDSLAFLDTTANHGSHVYDMNCKICNKQQSATPDKLESTKSSETKMSSTTKAVDNKDDPKNPQQKEPKRLRISIQTNLDPADLSRLKEPLIKPVEQPQNPAEFSPSKLSPTSNSPSGGIEEDNDDLYDPETSTIPPHSHLNSECPGLNSECWSGTIASSQIAKFNAIAKPVSGNLNFMDSEISRTLSICGRISPDQIGSYIKKIKSTTKNPILLVQLFPSSDDDKASFNKFFDHLRERHRCGVIEVGAFQPVLKDFYLMPIHNGNIPDYLKPISGPGLDKTDPNCLLGLLVKQKRPSSASSSSSSYTPTLTK